MTSRLPTHGYRITVNLRLGREQCQPMLNGLAHQQTIERVAMHARQPVEHQRVRLVSVANQTHQPAIDRGSPPFTAAMVSMLMGIAALHPPMMGIAALHPSYVLLLFFRPGAADAGAARQQCGDGGSTRQRVAELVQVASFNDR